MAKSLGFIEYTVQIIVASAACAVAPIRRTLATEASRATLSLPEILKHSPGVINIPTEPIAEGLKKSLKRPAFYTPPNFKKILPPILGGTIVTPGDLVICEANPDRILGALLNRPMISKTLLDQHEELEYQISDIPYRTHEMERAVWAWLQPSLANLLEDTKFVDVFAPQICANMLDSLRHMRKTNNQATKPVKISAQQLESLSTLPRDSLDQLARRFAIAAPYNINKSLLLDILSKNADQFRSYHKSIKELITNAALREAVLDAAERLELEEVDSLLVLADPVNIKAAANIKQLHAINGLLQRKVQVAFELLEAAADSFYRIDPVEPSRRRLEYGKILYDYGLMFLGKPMLCAVDIWSKAIADIRREQDSELWADLQYNLGCAQLSYGVLEAENARLEQAIIAFENTLKERPRDKAPQQWAMTQSKLGEVFLVMNNRQRDETSLSKAEAHVRAALEVFEVSAPHYAGMAREQLQQIATRRGDGGA